MSNPTPNQPLDIHPGQALMKAEALGADGLFFAPGDVIDGGDTLIVPGPPEGVVRRAGGGGGDSSTGVFITGAIALTGTTYVLKKKAGGEVVLQVTGAIGSNSAFFFTGFSPAIFLTDEDVGIFLRAAGGSGAVDLVTGYSFWTDVRNTEVQNTPILSTDRVVVLSSPADKNFIRHLDGFGGSQAGGALIFYNVDSVDIMALAFLSNGVVDIPFQSFTAPYVNGGFAGVLGNFSAALLPGWSIKVELDIDPVTRPPIVTAVYFDTNFAPVRQDQGGAY